MICLDTSALIRVITNDVPTKAKYVGQILESSKKVYIPSVVFLEIDYVVQGKVYGNGKDKVLKFFNYLASKKNIKISKYVRKAIVLYEVNNISFVDCLLVAYSTKYKLVTYDNDLQKLAKKL